MDHTEYSRILGALMGCSIGDAMGMPSEMWSQARIQRTFGEITGFLPGPADNEISAGFAPGDTTDDSIVTMLVAENLVAAKGDLQPMDLVRSIEAWAKENPKSKTVIGPSTQRAFQQIANGTPPELAGRSGETNGASMRISPVGILGHSDRLPELTDRVAQVCMPTHNTVSAISAASAVAAAVAHGIDGKPLTDAADCILEAAQLGCQHGYELCSPSVPERIRFSLELSAAYPDDKAFMERQYHLVGCGLPSWESVPTAIAIALRCGGDMMRCARMCANIGGDTDTMGAIACAITGAHTGVESIDQDALALIRRQNDFAYEQTARDLLNLRQLLTQNQ